MHAPYTHDLVRLARITGIEFSKEQMDYLREISGFNIEARYDNIKMEFYKKASKNYFIRLICQGKTEKMERC